MYVSDIYVSALAALRWTGNGLNPGREAACPFTVHVFLCTLSLTCVHEMTTFISSLTLRIKKKLVPFAIGFRFVQFMFLCITCHVGAVLMYHLNTRTECCLDLLTFRMKYGTEIFLLIC